MDYGWNGITYIRWLIIRLWYAYARYANARYANARYANARLWKYGSYVRGIYVLKRQIEISFINSNKFIKGI